MALGSAAIAGLGSLFAAWRASGWRDKAKTKVFAGFSTLLAVGGVVGLASAVNYRFTMEALGQELYTAASPKTCTSGCLVSLCAGVLAAVGAIGIVVRAIAVTKQRQASAKPSDSVETPPTPPPDPETEPEPEAEEPGFVRKLSSFLFGEEEPVEGVVVDEKEMYNRIAAWYDKPENAGLRARWGPYPKLEEFQAWPGFVRVTNAFLDAEPPALLY